MDARKIHFVVAVLASGFVGFLIGLLARPRTQEDSPDRRAPSSAPPVPKVTFKINLENTSPDANPQTIDLSTHFNADTAASWHTPGTPNDLSELPKGPQTLKGTTFTISGIIQLTGRVQKPWASNYPDMVTNIRVGISCRRLQFLQGTGVADRDGSRIGKYVVHYASGQTAEIPILYGKNVRDWWWNPKYPEPSDCVVAWTGSNGAAKEKGMSLRLYKMTWMNPRPEDSIESLDFVSSMGGSAPFLLAVTADALKD
jgi:hypothetical protein